MNKVTFLIVSAIVMLCLNIVIIAYFITTNDLPFLNAKRKMPREIVIEKLHFNHSQIRQYDVFIKAHQKKIKQLNDAIRFTKNKLYAQLQNNSSPITQKNELVAIIISYQRQIEITHYNHFLEIKRICKKDQLQQYNELTRELAKIFNHPKKNK